MSTTDRRAREKAATAQKILDGARELFLKEGFEGVSMRRLAEAIEYTPAALYVHFKDKSDLIRAMCRQDFGALSAKAVKLARIADPIERIARTGEVYIRFGVQHPNHYRLMFMTPRPSGIEPAAEDLAVMNDPGADAYAFLKHSVTEAIAAGLLRPGLTDPELVTQVLWSAVHGVVSLQITHHNDPCISWRSLEKRTRLLLDSVIDGILSAPARAARRRSAAVPLGTSEARA